MRAVTENSCLYYKGVRLKCNFATIITIPQLEFLYSLVILWTTVTIFPLHLYHPGYQDREPFTIGLHASLQELLLDFASHLCTCPFCVLQQLPSFCRNATRQIAHEFFIYTYSN